MSSADYFNVRLLIADNHLLDHIVSNEDRK